MLVDDKIMEADYFLEKIRISPFNEEMSFKRLSVSDKKYS
jgi:hypothetical protein